jgi:uncharacterized membrane protein YccC
MLNMKAIKTLPVSAVEARFELKLAELERDMKQQRADLQRQHPPSLQPTHMHSSGEQIRHHTALPRRV